MSANVLVLSGIADATLTATDSARKERDGLLAMAARVTNVTSLAEANSAATALQSLKGFTRQIEEARVAVKAPVIELGKKIDGLAKELTLELESEAVRIGRTVGTWQAEERRKEEEAQRKAREEEARIWREAQEKERLEQERLRKEEADRAAKARALQAELDAKAARARSEAGKAKAAEAAEAARIAEQIAADQRQADEEAAAAKRREEAGKAMVAARIAGNQIVAAKPAGVATREEIVFEVTDVVALYEAAAYLVTLEPNRTAIKAALKNLRPDQSLPGVKWWKEAKTHVR